MTVWGKALQHPGVTEDSADRREMTEQHVNSEHGTIFPVGNCPGFVLLDISQGENVFLALRILSVGS